MRALTPSTVQCVSFIRLIFRKMMIFHDDDDEVHKDDVFSRWTVVLRRNHINFSWKSQLLQVSDSENSQKEKFVKTLLLSIFISCNLNTSHIVEVEGYDGSLENVIFWHKTRRSLTDISNAYRIREFSDLVTPCSQFFYVVSSKPLPSICFPIPETVHPRPHST